MNSKESLEKLSARQELELTQELNRISEKGSNLVTNALFIIGGLAITYSLFKVIVGDQSKTKKAKEKTSSENPEVKKNNKSAFSEVIQTLTESAVLFLLGLAKEKLTDYLNSKDETIK